MTNKLALFVSAMAAASLGASAAIAADATASTSAAAASTAEVGAIVVTARKREENVQQIPVAVTAQTGQQLTRQNIFTPNDLTRIVPSLTIVNTASSPTGSIAILRGQAAADVLLTLSQPVGFYEDSVNIPHPEGTDVALFDISRVEVLNGPQGTLYGRNTTGGAINYITRGADYDGYHGFLYGEGGNYDDWKISGAVNIPIIPDVFAARIAYQHWSREGYGRSLITGERFGGDKDDDIVRASFRWDPSPRFSAIGKAEFVHANRTDVMTQSRELGGSVGTAGQLVGPGTGAFLCGAFRLPLSNAGNPASCFTVDLEYALEAAGGVQHQTTLLPSQQIAAQNNLFVNFSTPRTFEHLTAWHGVFDANYKVTDDINLRLITGVHQFKDFRTFDLDALDVQQNSVGSAINGLQPVLGSDPRPLRPDEQSIQWTQEVDASGLAFDKRLNWLLGAFYSDDQGNSEQRALALIPLTKAVTDFYNPSITNRSWAIFTQDDFKFNDVFSLTVGGRYTDEYVGQLKSVYNFSVFPTPTPYTCTQGPNTGLSATNENFCAFSQSLRSSGWSYLFSFNAQVTPDVLLYAKTARGFRGGALQIRADAPPVKPEIATDYELGAKTEWWDHRLLVNLALYDTEYSNKQETQIILDPVTHAASTAIVNAASARIRGVEGQVNFVPTDGLTFYSTFDYLHGVYTNFPNALLPGGAILPNAEGTLFPYAPWKFDIGGRYEHPLWNGVIAAQADYAWTAQIPSTVLTVDPGLSPALLSEWTAAVGIMNARIEYNVPSHGLGVAIFATNLLNKHYQTAGLAGLPGFYTGITQAPIEWGISIRKTFGGGE